ncbi:LacI family transcriptional regulator [Rhodococcoides trifolii]|uniref:LacI family transcriptional regulator n=2 Tax=Rhodococcoides trifolii TaxID=908250 RepID=A0A917G7B1_9NOCA|nr:LacI family transcriptional regulator [Rhodococcus trifolii]
MVDVAREAGVSRALVSLVMRETGYVSPEKRTLVLDTARRLGYRRNALAANLASKTTNSIGLAIFDLHNQVYADFADGVLDVIGPTRYQLLLSTSTQDESSLAAGIETLVGLRPDGILLATHVPEHLDLSAILAGTPTVMIGEDPLVELGDAVHGEDEAGAFAATDHLIKQGHRDIVYVEGPSTLQNHARRAGYSAAVERASLRERVVSGDATEDGGQRALLGLRRSNSLPTAVFCYNDSTAVGVLIGARRERLSVPQDLAVVGYDNTRAASYPGVDLTSVDPKARHMGAQAAELLLGRIEEPSLPGRTNTLTHQLIIRGSSDHLRSR